MQQTAGNRWRALGLSALFLVSSNIAQADNSGVHGWDKPELAEFTMRDIRTHFTTGEPPVTRDIHVDCDLLVKDGNKRHYTTGFAIQFNAETNRTYEIVGPANMRVLQAWRGQLDYRGEKVKGTITHLEGAHQISRYTVKQAKEICMTDHSDHGMDINVIGKNYVAIHPDYR